MTRLYSRVIFYAKNISKTFPKVIDINIKYCNNMRERYKNGVIKTENKTLLTNKPIPPELEARANELLCGAMPLMAVVGDLKLSGRYGSGAILVCADRLIAVSKELETDGLMLLFEDIDEASVKRLYGNAVFRVKTSEGKVMDLLRFTYSTTDLCDAVSAPNAAESSPPPMPIV